MVVQLSLLGLYLPPLLKYVLPLYPPQTIISLPVHTAVWLARAVGPLMMLMAVQLLVLGLYRPPVFKKSPPSPNPPQTIISRPVQTAVWNSRPIGALSVLVAAQLSVAG